MKLCEYCERIKFCICCLGVFTNKKECAKHILRARAGCIAANSYPRAAHISSEASFYIIGNPSEFPMIQKRPAAVSSTQQYRSPFIFLTFSNQQIFFCQSFPLHNSVFSQELIGKCDSSDTFCSSCHAVNPIPRYILQFFFAGLCKAKAAFTSSAFTMR